MNIKVCNSARNSKSLHCAEVGNNPQTHTHSVTKSKLALLATRKASESEGVGVQAENRIIFKKEADRQNGRLMSPNNHLVRVWMSGSCMDQR